MSSSAHWKTSAWRRRPNGFVLVSADLATCPQASITAGLAELGAHDSLDDLIARADAALRAQRQRQSART